MTGSWKTSGLAIAALAMALIGAAQQLFDGDSTTNPDWNQLVPLVIASLTGLFTRDNKVTSEEAGAVTAPPTP